MMMDRAIRNTKKKLYYIWLGTCKISGCRNSLPLIRHVALKETFRLDTFLYQLTLSLSISEFIWIE